MPGAYNILAKRSLCSLARKNQMDILYINIRTIHQLGTLTPSFSLFLLKGTGILEIQTTSFRHPGSLSVIHVNP